MVVAPFALPSLVNSCKTIKHLKQIHSHLITSSPSLIPHLLFFISSSPNPSHLSYSPSLFLSIQSPDLFSYNGILRSLSLLSDPSLSPFSLFRHMLVSDIRPDHLTLPFLLKSLARLCDPLPPLSTHALASKVGLDCNLFVQNSLIHVYSCCKLTTLARQLFDEMLRRDIVSWNSVLSAYLRAGALDSALDHFSSMQERNIISWNSMITGLAQGGRAKEALEIFHQMLFVGEGDARPDKITIASVVSACASLGALAQGRWVHRYLKQQGLELDVVIATALVDMYGKCGSVEEAVDVFNCISKKDVLAWTAMISVYAVHGVGKEALNLLEEMQMQGVKPNHVTFVGLLSACAHAGLVEEGHQLFELMTKVYFIKPQVEHYACMVDMLGRAGLFKEAERLIRSMPMEPDVFVWGALLGGCRMHRNVDLGVKVAKYLIELEPQNHAFYIMLSDLYAYAQRYEDVKRVRALMRKGGIKKTAPGCSLIEVDGHIHEFLVQGSPEALMEEIELVLNGLNGKPKLINNLFAFHDNSLY